MIFMWKPVVLEKPGVGTIYLARRRKQMLFSPVGSSTAYKVPRDRMSDLAAATTTVEAMSIVRPPKASP